MLTVAEVAAEHAQAAFLVERIVNISAETAMFFRLPEDARWNSERQAVEFGVGVGEYEGIVRVPRQVFRRLLAGTATPERCLEAYHLQRTRFELIAERKLRNRQLTEDGNVEINGRDLRASSRPPTDSAQASFVYRCAEGRD